jgi:hypothetical protein
VPASLCDVLPSAAAVLGVPGAENRLGVVPGSARRVVVLLVDGMGMHLLPAMSTHAPLLASVLRGHTGRLDELRCTFPSTTPTSLVSLGTGRPPGEHGILGFTLRVPDTGRILTHIFWRDDPAPRQWQPLHTWFQRVAEHDLAASVVLPAMFANSGLTDAAYRGAAFVGVDGHEDYAGRVLDVLDGAPGLTFAYTAALDTAAHLFGIGSPQWQLAAAEVDVLVSRLADGLPADAVLLVTADHGGINVAADARFDLDRDLRLGAGVEAVAGEPRVRYLHTRPDAVADVIAAWRAVLGEHADVLTRDAAIAAGLFGPVAPAHSARIGDVVVICTGRSAVLASAHEPPEVARLIGLHGALTLAETAIPLITFGT